MSDLQDGETVEVKGSAAKPYLIKNVGGLYSCTCPAWRNQSVGIEQRTCKHIRKIRGDAAEVERLGTALANPVRKSAGSNEEGEDAAGPPLLLAESWDDNQDLAGWWMSEKLDGVRAYWDGQQFISRLGNIYRAPEWFVEGLPAVTLDGELWIDRKKFQRTVGIVRRQDQPDLWQEVRFLVFDAPLLAEPFERRHDYVQELFREQQHRYAQPHSQLLCQGISHLREELLRVESLGGEGLMLRQPGSLYEVGRSTTLLKIKTFHDAEATVIGHEKGAGKHKGRLGSLLVQLPDGTQFNVGTGFRDQERENPPPVGSLITFRYQELSDAGVPRFPSYVGLRRDAVPQGVGPADLAPLAVKVPADNLAQTPANAPVVIPVVIPANIPVVASLPQQVPAASSNSPRAATAKQYFECVDDGSSKFWEVWVEGCDLKTRWGKIGSDGRITSKTFSTPEKALAEATQLTAEKTGKGYLAKPAE